MSSLGAEGASSSLFRESGSPWPWGGAGPASEMRCQGHEKRAGLCSLGFSRQRITTEVTEIKRETTEVSDPVIE